VQQKVEADSWVPPPPPLPPSDEALANDQNGLGIPPPPAGPPPPAELTALDNDNAADSNSVIDVIPQEDLHDGNVCEHNEERYGGLCYRTCNLLTHGSNPIRTSPWTCCSEHPCGLSNQLGNIGHQVLCNGYDVAGDGGCPHRPGACLKDEELLLGVCYKQCGILTHGEYPHRVGPLTCCKDSGLSCLDFRKDKTRAAFAVGGGGGDHDPSTPSSAHFPQRRWTEDANSSAGKHPSDASSATNTGADARSTLANQVVELKPDEDLYDGNVCEDNEERHAGLCYKTCSILTQGQAVIRTSPWTCCEAHPCNLHNQHGNLGDKVLCSGYDVSGDDSCPHKPGACLKDEELLLGVCYKKCEILTNGQFSHRVTPVTCCKEAGIDCFSFSEERTRLQFAIGGGKGDHDPSTPALAHAPEQRWTEARNLHQAGGVPTQNAS
jgi:hypothetical protein